MRHQEIGPAVAIVISNGRTHPVPTAGDAGLCGDVCEGSVPVVLVKRVAQRGIWVKKITLPAVDQVNVHPAVVVIIDERTPGTHGFGQVHFR